MLDDEDDDDTDLFELKPLVDDDSDVELRWLLVELFDEFCDPDTELIPLLADEPLLDVLLLDFFCFEFGSDLSRFDSSSFSGDDGASLECASRLTGL